MNDRTEHRPVEPGSDIEQDPEEIPLKVHDYARACRGELERLAVLQSDAAAGYQKVREAVARLESLAHEVHPLLSEKIRRVAAIVRRLGRSSVEASTDVAGSFESGGGGRDFYGTLYARLEEIQNSPLWALPAAARASIREQVDRERGPVLKPGEIYPDRVVFYMLGDLRFMVRGTLRYNLHRADLSREYATRKGGPVLPIFPNPDRDSKAFPAPAYGGNLMVFESPGRGETGCMALRYDRILGIEDYQPARHDRGLEPLSVSHPVVAGRLARAGVDYYVVRL